METVLMFIALGAALTSGLILYTADAYSDGLNSTHDHELHYVRQSWIRWKVYHAGIWMKHRTERAREARWQRSVKRGEKRAARRLKGKGK